MKALAAWAVCASALVTLPVMAGNATAPTPSAHIVNVKDFGAVCDGVTSDDAAINAAVATLTNGSTLVFPQTDSGCNVTAGITISDLDHISIVGSPRGTLVTTAITPRFAFVSIAGSTSDLRIEGMTFRGHATIAPTSGPVHSAVHVLRSARGSRILFTDNAVYGVNRGIVISSNTFNGCRITDNLFSDLVGGTSGYAAIYTVSKRNVISGNEFVNIPRHDVYLSGDYAPNGGAADNIVSGNLSIGSGLVAVAMYATATEVPVKGNRVTGNIFLRTRGMAIVMSQNAEDNTISGNVIDMPTADFGTGRGLITLNGSTAAGTHPGKNIIADNIITKGTGTAPGIYSQNASDNMIISNVLLDNPAMINAIEITTTGRGQVTAGNVIAGGPVRSITGSAATIVGTVVSGNCMNGRIVNIPAGAGSPNVVSGNWTDLRHGNAKPR